MTNRRIPYSPTEDCPDTQKETADFYRTDWLKLYGWSYLSALMKEGYYWDFLKHHYGTKSPQAKELQDITVHVLTNLDFKSKCIVFEGLADIPETPTVTVEDDDD